MRGLMECVLEVSIPSCMGSILETQTDKHKHEMFSCARIINKMFPSHETKLYAIVINWHEETPIRTDSNAIFLSVYRNTTNELEN